MTILNDIQLAELIVNHQMIEPFELSMVRELCFDPNSENGIRWDDSPRRVISHGLGSFGYDITLSPKDFRIFKHIPGTVIDPKNFNPDNLEIVRLQSDKSGSFFIIPSHSYGLGVSRERVKMPKNVTAVCLGKSTYARVGLICNTTPIEAAWEGHITLEISNSSGADCRVYANEGICQLLFFEGEPCETTYADRKGKYQGQSESVTLARV